VRVRRAQFFIPPSWRPGPLAGLDPGAVKAGWRQALNAGGVEDIRSRFPGDHFPLEFEMALTWRGAPSGGASPSPASGSAAKRPRS
jgi:hypothetical protein